ncbi:pentatricopeptide repeat domain-containing protein 3, mitochondrial-like isoform X2 [Pecten maximus]|uniref:pentatricopeptide repeat domain-containing protein 3, mitochondrial-like isoform X2 n=1 Tax=Pecten maximus TaxID=6579 RepID=UPI0014590344|nr:pentatricopeptide repeat domain-containing protein 3, mitochondrial-like isoform X2 [Pecten maximus]
MATSMHIAWKRYNTSHRLLQATLNHLYGNIQQRCCHMAAVQTVTPTQAKLMRIKRDIKIPLKKKRDSLSVLRTLSEVAGKDHSMPDYKPTYTDDSYLIPYIQQSINYRFALQSGRATAQYFIEKFPECFAFEKSAPHIPAFEPKQGYAKLEDVSEEALQERIQIHLVSESLKMFEKLIEEGVNVSVETVEQLMELVMFHFGKDPDRINDNPFNLQAMLSKEAPDPPSDEFVHKLMSSLTVEKTPRIYKAVILGCCKNEHIETALGYYKEMKGKGLKCDRDIFHALLSANPWWSKALTLPPDTAIDLLRDMKAAGVAPTQETFSRLASGPGLECSESVFFSKILSEVKALGMKPSLSMCRPFLKFIISSQDLQQILKHVEAENIKAASEEEMRFFIDAMKAVDNPLRSPNMAKEVDRVFRILGEGHYFYSVEESRAYYRSLLYALIFNDTLENIMEMYDKLVPHKISTFTLPLRRLWRIMKLHNNFQHVPKLLRDIYLNGKKLDSDHFQEALNVVDTISGPPELLQEVAISFEYIKDDAVRMLKRNFSNRNKSELNYLMVASKVSLKAGHLEQAWEYFELGEDYRGFTKNHCVELHQHCVDKGDSDKAERVEAYMRNFL